jgi:hypothetical protein
MLTGGPHGAVTRMELQPGARTDASPDERGEPDNAGGGSLETGGRYRPGRKGLKQMIITFLIAKIILGGYWLMLAPVLFLPLGIVFLSSQVRRGLFGHVVIPLAVVFAALGAVFLFTLTLRDGVTVVAGVQAIWLLAAAIMLLSRNRKQRGSQFQELRTAKSSITR